MRSKIITIFIIIFSLIMFIPSVSADYYDEDHTCNRRASADYKCPMFGDPNDDGEGANDTDCDGLPSTANFLQSIFTFIRYFGPALAIVLSIVEFVKAAAAQDADALAKAAKKTGWRVGLAILLFFIPVIINAVFSWFGWYGTCGIR